MNEQAMPKDAEQFIDNCCHEADYWANEIMRMHLERRNPAAPFGSTQLSFIAALAQTMGCCVRASADLGGVPGSGEALLAAMLEIAREAYRDNPLQMTFEVAQ